MGFAFEQLKQGVVIQLFYMLYFIQFCSALLKNFCSTCSGLCVIGLFKGHLPFKIARKIDIAILLLVWKLLSEPEWICIKNYKQRHTAAL